MQLVPLYSHAESIHNYHSYGSSLILYLPVDVLQQAHFTLCDCATEQLSM